MAYSAFNLAIESATSIPGARHLDVRADKGPQVRITSAAQAFVAGAEVTRQLGPYTLYADGSVVFCMPDGSRFHANGPASELTIYTGGEGAPTATAEDGTAVLIATALPMLLWMRGHLLLHASAAVLPGATAAVAIAGDTGSGKSKVLYELYQRGASVLAEDCLTFGPGEPPESACGLPGCLYLRKPGAALDAARSVQRIPIERQQSVARLGTLVVLPPNGTKATALSQQGSFVRCSPPEALRALLKHRHRARIPALLGLDGQHLPRWSALASKLPVYAWHSASGSLPSADQIADLLQRDIAKDSSQP